MKVLVKIAFIGFVSLLMFSCVSKKEFAASQDRLKNTELDLDHANSRLSECQNNARAIASDAEKAQSKLDSKVNDLKGQVTLLSKELELEKRNNENLVGHIADLSNIGKSESENLKKTLEELAEQRKYIKSLNEDARSKDSVNLALVTNLKRSLADVNDSDVNIEVRKGVVYISISDKLLFKSGSSRVNSRAEEVLGKVAKVINDHSDLEVMVEGHTDNVGISSGKYKDNWDLSVLRATSIVRVLQTKYNVLPERMTAAGRSEFVPKTSNDTKEGRSINRRTEIVLTPKLNQYFNLLKK